jgi:hypothetical protein
MSAALANGNHRPEEHGSVYSKLCGGCLDEGKRLRAPCFLLRLILGIGLLQPNCGTAWTTAATAGFTLGILGNGQPAAAQAPSSGGYSRPSGSSIGGGGARRPSTGGGGAGYSRPYSAGSAGSSAFSGGDRSMSRGYSGQAFRDYQQRQQAGTGAAAASPWDRRRSTYGGDNGSFAPARRPPAQNSYGPGGGLGGATPYPGGQSRFGAWDAIFLMSLLNSLSTPGHTQFFRDNRDNPDYLAWRREADRMAQRDPAFADKLAELDRRMAGQPGDTSGRWEDTSRRPSAGAAEKSGGSGVVMPVIIIGAGSIFGLWFMRRRSLATAGSPAVPGLSGSAQTRFRVGMTFPVDPSPFLLAAGVTKVKPPQGDGMASIEAVGVVSDGSTALHRLYFPGRDAFLQLHLAGSGEPDECRYFNVIDEVTPSSQDEWGFWLDPAQGMIGWPQFQTKDGKMYDRVWAPGADRVEPRQQTETIQDLQGTHQRKLLSMLYGARTGVHPPAPDTEYILVFAVEDGGKAWVEVHTGIDINPATLSLPSIPLSA